MKIEDKENFPLADKSINAKGEECLGVFESSQKGKKKDLSKINYFHCHEFGRYATKFPKRKKESSKGHATTSMEVDTLSS